MTSHGDHGDLCTDECVHLCDACERGYTKSCVDLFQLPGGSVVACMSDEVVT